MKSEIVNMHKKLRNSIMKIECNNKINTISTAAELTHSTNEELEDYDVIMEIAENTASLLKHADAKLKDTILGILIVDNYKYLYKSLKNVELDLVGFDHLILYRKIDDLQVLKEKMKKDNDFFFTVLRNVIDLYYMTSEEEYFFLQDVIKKTNMEGKFLKVDPTYIFDKMQYDELPNYDLQSLFGRACTTINSEEEASIDIYKNVTSEQIYNSLKLLNIYDVEKFQQNLYDILMTNYHIKREKVKDAGIKYIPKKDLLFMYQMESSPIINIIDSFYPNKVDIVDLIAEYLSIELEKEKIKQKNPNQ